jgi:hypothetical protein
LGDHDQVDQALELDTKVQDHQMEDLDQEHLDQGKRLDHQVQVLRMVQHALAVHHVQQALDHKGLLRVDPTVLLVLKDLRKAQGL